MLVLSASLAACDQSEPERDVPPQETVEEVDPWDETETEETEETAESGNLAPGTSLELGLVTVSAPDGALLREIEVEVFPVDLPERLPGELVVAGDAIDIVPSEPEALNAPLVLQASYDDSAVPNEDHMLVLHYDEQTGYQATTVLRQDQDENTITFESRDFSVFVIVAYLFSDIPDSHMVTGFEPRTDGWNIPNFGSYFAPGGNCLGMSAMSAWFFPHRPEPLWGMFPSDDSVSIAHLVAMRAHLAQSQYWASKFYHYDQQLGERTTAESLRAMLSTLDEPVVLVMVNNAGGHAAVVYGYDEERFYFYDVNTPGSTESVSYSDANGFGEYSGYQRFGYVALPSFGRTEDFEALVQDAVDGFEQSSFITVASPEDEETLTERRMTVTGSLSGALTTGAQLVVYANGVPTVVAASAGSFSATLPVSAGENTLVFFAGVDISRQSNWYRNAACLMRTVEGDFPLSDLLVTLTWGQNDTDVDLYTTDPNGDTAWYSSMSTAAGGYLDFDNTQGYGPEHYILSEANGATILEGDYIIRLHYYSDHDTGQVATGQVSLVLSEGTDEQVFRTFNYVISASSSGNASPGSAGPDWIDIARVDMFEGTITPML